MSFVVFAVVIGAAVLHASWNAIVKAAPDKVLTTVLVTVAAAAIAAVALPILALPAKASLPYAVLSALLQTAYFVLVAHTYNIADMSQTYPLMRGSAPLLVATVMATRGGELLSPTAWVGVGCVSLGIFSIALGTHVSDRKGVYLALVNSVVIAGYTLVDAIGVRRSGAPAAYTLLVFLLTGLPFAVWALVFQRGRFQPYLRRYWHLGVIGAMGTTASYGLALWAMTRAPVAVIAALRETSILFGTIIAGAVIKEHVGWRRILSACIIAAGAALLRLA